MATDPTPVIPAPPEYSVTKDSVKIATPDLLIGTSSNTMAIDSIADLLFQQIGGHEIISISRNDLVNGRNTSYQLVRNLEDINIEYNSNNILPIPGGSDDYFNSFPIRFNDHIPTIVQKSLNSYVYLENEAYGPGANGQTVYIDDDGNLVIDMVNIKDTHRVEVEIISSTTIEDDTIYI